VGKTHKDAASVRATHPIPSACGIYYFEVRIISKGRDGWVLGRCWFLRGLCNYMYLLCSTTLKVAFCLNLIVRFCFVLWSCQTLLQVFQLTFISSVWVKIHFNYKLKLVWYDTNIRDILSRILNMDNHNVCVTLYHKWSSSSQHCNMQ